MSDAYQKIKKHNGEAFAQELRNYHNGLLEIDGIDQIVRHAGRDASVLLPYLMGLLTSNDDVAVQNPQDPFTLLDQAGYNAFYADTLERQNSIQKYFQPGELLCTFNDCARYSEYHIVHAIKKDVDQIKRSDFTGREQRQDAYGTSVISIQMLRNGGFISIKNRYNHTVAGCDNTFSSNPDNIIEGLSASLKRYFKVDFTASQSELPEGFVVLSGQVLAYREEANNIYYGDQLWGQNGIIHAVDRATGDAMFDKFVFDNKNKVLKKIDPSNKDSFADDFNRCYGGNPGLTVQAGNLVLDGIVLIGTEQSRIKTLCLPALETMGECSLYEATSLVSFEANALVSMGKKSLSNVDNLISFKASSLKTMAESCLYNASAMTQFEVKALSVMGDHCLCGAWTLTEFKANALIKMGRCCLYHSAALLKVEAKALVEMDVHCFEYAKSLRDVSIGVNVSLPLHLQHLAKPMKKNAPHV